MAFFIILLIGINGSLPSSLIALDGAAFETNKGTQFINSQSAWFVLAVLVLMAIWWATEALPVAVTSLLPLALFPLLNVATFQAQQILMLIKIFIFSLVVLFWRLVLKDLDFISE